VQSPLGFVPRRVIGPNWGKQPPNVGPRHSLSGWVSSLAYSSFFLSSKNAMDEPQLIPCIPFPSCVLSMPQDPYLNYQPHYAFSLPVQILLNGIITALVAVLLIQLLFTAPYHWPLAKLNFALQVTGVVTLLISLIATLWLVLTTAHAASSEWPYMLDYIAITVPPSTWSDAKKTWWYIMQATTSGIVQASSLFAHSCVSFRAYSFWK
jgi:hypothetical protein